MKKLALLIVSLLLAAFGLRAQLLWQVADAGGNTRAYLFGTHHLAPDSLIDTLPGLLKALRNSDVVIGEINLTDSDPGELQRASLAHSFAPADSLLSDLLSPAQLDSLDNVLSRYSSGTLSSKLLNRMKPSAVASTIAMLQAQLYFPEFQSDRQLDLQIMLRGKEEGKELQGLETVDEQLTILFDAPLTDQAADLMSLVRDDAEAERIVHELSEAYMRQDLQAVASLMEQDHSDEAALRRLLYDRNIRWADKLTAILPDRCLFIAVGAGHLPGDKGLINLLRARGYTLTPAAQ